MAVVQSIALPPTNVWSSQSSVVVESALRLNDDERRTTNDESEHSKINEVLDSSSTPLATYVIDHESLPPSGLRALDDVTLYRYLLADRWNF